MRRGVTLMEMLISVGLLGILLGAVLFLYLVGGRAIAQGDVRSDLMRDLQVTSMKLTQEIETSCYAGLSVGAGGVAVLSAVPAGGGSPGLGPDGSVIWAKYVVFWHDAGTAVVKRQEYPITPTTSGQPIEMWEGKTLADYQTGGTVIGRNITGLTFEVPPGSTRLKAILTGQRLLKGKPHRLDMSFTLRLKN
ncbi:MAG: prepilin-type N-terminal cleavage/methylation domain-containing protein [Candidatus Eremiobacterota bacterium]